MYHIFILLMTINYVKCFETIKKSCFSCKFFIPNETNQDLGLCKLFEKNQEGKITYNLASYCCDNENMCGKNRTCYTPKNIDNIVWDYHVWINNKNKLLEEELKRMHNENKLLEKELSQIYKEHYYIFVKREKYNKIKKHKYLQ